MCCMSVKHEHMMCSAMEGRLEDGTGSGTSEVYGMYLCVAQVTDELGLVSGLRGKACICVLLKSWMG